MTKHARAGMVVTLAMTLHGVVRPVAAEIEIGPHGILRLQTGR